MTCLRRNLHPLQRPKGEMTEIRRQNHVSFASLEELG